MVIPGYTQSRATQENYDDFVDIFTKKIAEENIGISLIGYGTYFNKPYTIGRSDIDMLIIFSDDVVINKDNFSKASNILANSLLKSKLNHRYLNLIPLDYTTLRNGRLNPFENDYHLNNYSTVLCGDVDSNEFNYLLPQTTGLHTFRHNLTKVRKSTLIFDYLCEEEKESAVDLFQKGLDKITSSTRIAMQMIDSDLSGKRFDDGELKKMFLNVDFQIYDKLKELYAKPKELDSLYVDNLVMKNVLYKGLTFMEELAKEYLCMSK